MIKYAYILSEDFIHVRVDLIEHDGHIFFNEFTFTTCNGDSIKTFNNIYIVKLLQILKIKIIIFNHNAIFNAFYYNLMYRFKELYRRYNKFQLVLNLVPIESKYLYRNWGIKNVISINNFMPFDIKSVKPLNLSSKNIIMLGRGTVPNKNFDLGIRSMKYIVRNIPDSRLFIASSGNLTYLKRLAEKLNIKENVIFTGYRVNLSDILANSSLHLFLSYSESFGNVLLESKIYGIPTILLGMEYLTLFNGGTILAENDSPETIANAAIKIIKNEKYRKKLGKEARKSLKKFENEIILKRWIKIIKAVYKGKGEIQKLINEEEKLDKKDAFRIIEKEILKLKIRKPKYKYFEAKNLFNFSYMCTISSNIKYTNKKL